MKKYQFNKTEPETLASLVEKAVKTGNEVKDELKRFREITDKLLKILENKPLIVITPPREIGDLDFNSQVKLLRVLQDKTYQVLGESVSHKTDVRVICATNRHLQEMVKKGTFREDLFIVSTLSQ